MATHGSEPRDTATRITDTLAMLRSPGIDAWVATTCADNAPYVVPLTPAWLPGDRILLATARRTLTARNLEATGKARLAYGPTRDVVLVDATVEQITDVAADTSLGEQYVAQADWDPRGVAGYVFTVLRAHRIQAWRNEAEIAGRVLMRAGTWVGTRVPAASAD